MRTVKEISDLTGISVRTLHYYDEIGLLKPTEKSEAGYRLYDDEALKTLQQILFFREFDIPLKKINAVMNNPALDRNQILQMQRKMLVAKKERMERLISSIDDYAKVVEWYGGKDNFLSVANNPVSTEVAESYNKRMEAILQKLIAKRGCDVDAFEVKEVVGEFGFVMKQFTQVKNEEGLMLAHAQYYRNEKIRPMIDEKYGEGASEFFAQAIEAFYKHK